MPSDPVKKGAILLQEQPFAYVLKSALNSQRCDSCLQKAELLTCQGCNYVRYCDRTCQKKGWYFHKRECEKMKGIAPRILPDAGRLLARIILKLDKGGAREQGFYSPRQFRVFMDLMSHYNDIKNDSKRMEHFESLYAVLLTFFKNDVLPNPVELLRIYGKMVINTFCIQDGEMQGIASGLYLGASIVDHSCNPNAVAVFNGTKLTIRTLIDRASVDWSKVYISYIDLMRFPADRQKDLLKNYYFLCQCSRCLDVEELGIMNCVYCENEDCGGSIPNGHKGVEAKCPKCEETMTPERWETVFDVFEFSDQQIEAMADIAYIDVCRLCLKKQGNILDDMNIRRVRIMDMTMESSIDMGFFESAYDFGRRLIAPYRRYYGDRHPLTGILLMKMGKLASCLNMEGGRKYFKEAAEILLVTHGENHPLIREELLPNLRQCTS